jgi:L-asparaginase
MLILNCGGTFNKIYNKKNGQLDVAFNNHAIEKILQTCEAEYDLAGVMYKDSLDMDINDRKILANIIMESKDDKFIVVHGTDTMDESAEFLDGVFDDRKIVLVGAMKPFEIDNVEASYNLGMAMGFLNAQEKNGVYICMNGFSQPWDKIVKNKNLGKFELV